jgi:hypothetical protein
LGAALLLSNFTKVHAQCATCVTPTVAYAPVVTQPAVVTPTIVRTGWYPGYWIDRMRLNRWSRNAVTTAPTYTTGYAPVYTAAYAPAVTHTASYAPYLTSYAPLQQPVVQTSYLPAATSACCPQTSPTAVITTSYAPSTVYRPVEVQPVVDTVVASPCSCPAEAPCSNCPTCPTGVSQAVYSEGAPAGSACVGCAESGGTPSYTFGTESAVQGSTTQGSTGQGTSSGLEQPTLAPNEPAPGSANYGGTSSGTTGAAGTTSGTQEATGAGAAPSPLPDDGDGAASEPGTGAESKPSDASTFYEFPEAPPLMGPQNDRTAHRPTVDVHNAVYRRPVRNANVSTTVAKPATTSSQASAGNGGGWYSISER